MDNALIVCSFNRLGDLFSDRKRLSQRNRAARDPICECRPFDQLHHQREGPVAPSLHLLAFQSEHVGDVRMIQCREDLRFSVEARESIRIRSDRHR